MTDPTPTPFAGLIPHLVCDNASDAIAFYVKAFGAEEMCRIPAPGGDRLIHASISIDGQPVFLVDNFPEYCAGKSTDPKALGGTAVTLHRNVADCDAAVRRAADAGCTVTMPPHDAFWGDRYGQVTDPFGHAWSFATPQRTLTPEQIQAAMGEAFQQADAAGAQA